MSRRALVAAAAGLLVLVFAARAIVSLRQKSLTVDEEIHIPSGLLALRAHDFRISPEHPPLSKTICALPLLALDLDLALDEPAFEAARTDVAKEWEWARAVLYRANAGRLDEIAFLARLPMVLMGALLCLCVFFFARD